MSPVTECVDGWVWEDNVLPLMLNLAYTVRYDFEQVDWSTVEADLANTDAQQGRWVHLPLDAQGVLNVTLAREPGEPRVRIRASDVPNEVIRALVETCLSQFGN